MDSFRNKPPLCVHAYYIKKYIAPRDFDLSSGKNFNKPVISEHIAALRR